MTGPIFIVGSPRSGTTLLRLMLTSHPSIVIPPECAFAIWLREKYCEWNVSHAVGSQAESFLADLKKCKKIETWNLDFLALFTDLKRVRPSNYSKLVSLVYECYARRSKSDFLRWGDKNNFHVLHVKTLHTLFPNAQFVHIVRDGRDVACSYRSLGTMIFKSVYAPKLPMDIREIAEVWRANLEAVRSGFDTLPVAQRLEIRYEDLVSQSERTLRSICDFLGEPYDEQMLQYHLANRRDELEPSEFLQWKAKTLCSPDATRLGKFRDELTSEELIIFEGIAEPLLREYRYV